jgi:hypothetical protein
MLPEEVRFLIQSTVPTIDALEVLLFLARHPGTAWRASEIVNQMQPTVITQTAAAEYIALFEEHGLVVAQEDDAGSFVYGPASPELAEAMAALVLAYNERPVTLIRVVYEVANSKSIRSFADAFKFKKK